MVDLTTLGNVVRGVARVKVATTANVDIASPGGTIDGVALGADDRVLAKDQTAAAENGVYQWNGAASPMTRFDDADTGAKIAGAIVRVLEGTANAGKVFYLETPAPITLGTTALSFADRYFDLAQLIAANAPADIEEADGDVVVAAAAALRFLSAFLVTNLGSGRAGVDLVAALKAVSALTPAADRLAYYTSASAAALATLTAVARTLLEQTTQALMRTTGLGLSANGSSLVSAADYAAMRELLDLEGGTDFYSIAAADAAIAAAKPTESLIVVVGDETTAITTGAGKLTFRMPYAFTLTGVRASCKTAPIGATLIIDINEGGVSVLSTKLSIDATETTSTTAATPAVISDAALADDAEITIDFDQVGSTVAGAGVKVALIGKRT